MDFLNDSSQEMKNEIEFLETFKEFGTQIRYTRLRNFFLKFCILLSKMFKNKPQHRYRFIINYFFFLRIQSIDVEFLLNLKWNRSTLFACIHSRYVIGETREAENKDIYARVSIGARMAARAEFTAHQGNKNERYLISSLPCFRC